MPNILLLIQRQVKKGIPDNKNPVWYRKRIDEQFSIGREGTDIICNLPFVSRKHVVIFYKPGIFFGKLYLKETSKNGTWYLAPRVDNLSKAILVRNQEVAIAKGSTFAILDEKKENGFAWTVHTN